MLSLNVRNKSGKNIEDYYSVLIQLNYDNTYAEKSKTFFACLYFELTVNFGFNFVDRVFYRVDSYNSISALLAAAIKVVMLQQKLSREDVQQIVKHAFIIPLQQFNDIRKEIIQ